jgi:hypothetical protein
MMATLISCGSSGASSVPSSVTSEPARFAEAPSEAEGEAEGVEFHHREKLGNFPFRLEPRRNTVNSDLCNNYSVISAR